MEQIVDFPVVHFDHPEHQLPAQSECQRRFWVNDRLHRLDDVLFRDGVFIQFAVHVRGEPDGPERASFGENELRIEHIVVVDCRHTTTTRSVLDSEFKFKPPLFSRKCVSSSSSSSSSSSLKINTTRALLLGGKKKNVSFAKVSSRRATLRVLSRSSLGQHERVFLSFFERKNERKIWELKSNTNSNYK